MIKPPATYSDCLYREDQPAGRDVRSRLSLLFDHRFDGQAAAVRMAARVQQDGVAAFVVATHVTPSGGRWVVRHLMAGLPTAEAVDDVEARLTTLAEACGGVAEGWTILPV